MPAKRRAARAESSFSEESITSSLSDQRGTRKRIALEPKRKDTGDIVSTEEKILDNDALTTRPMKKKTPQTKTAIQEARKKSVPQKKAPNEPSKNQEEEQVQHPAAPPTQDLSTKTQNAPQSTSAPTTHTTLTDHKVLARDKEIHLLREEKETWKQATQDHANEIAILTTEKNSWKQAAQDWSTCNATINMQNHTLSIEIQRLKAESHTSQTKLTAQQTQILTLQDQVQRAAEPMLQRQVKELGAENERIKTQMSVLVKDTRARETLNKGLIDELGEAKKKLYEFKKRVRNLGNEF